MSTISLLLWLLLHFGACAAKRDFVIEISHCNCSLHQPRLFSQLKCRNYIEHGLSYIYSELVFTRDLPNFQMQTSFDMVRKNNKRLNLFKLDFDGCVFFETGYATVSFTHFGLRELRRTSNFPKKCPMKAGIKYIVRNYTVNPEDYPEYTPPMTFIWVVQFSLDNERQAELVMHGRVRKIKNVN